MSRRLGWSHLVPGLAALGTIVALAAAVLIFARVGALHGATLTLYAPAEQARGVIKGTEVWLAGQKIGLVAGVRFQPPGVPPERRLVMVLDILERYHSLLRRDSYAQIRAGGSLIGAPVVYISTGSAAAAPLESGDTLSVHPQSDIEGRASELALATRQFPELLANVRLIGAHLHSARGTAGAILTGNDVRELQLLLDRAGRVAGRATSGRGTVALALRRDEAAARLRHASAQLDSVRLLLASGRGSVGRFRRDSTLLSAVQDLRDDVSITRALLGDPRGSAGRFVRDSAIARELGDTERELGALIADIKSHPLRYVAF